MEIGKEKFAKTVSTILDGIENQLHTCAQVHISQYEETIASFSIGEFKDGHTTTVGTIMPWMSCSKMITAIAFAILVERGQVDWDTKVSEVIPEFANNGKEEISFANILTHTCGLRILSIKYEQLTWDETIAKICQMPIEKSWQIGQDAGYHVATSWFILGEAIQRLSGIKLNDFIREELFNPLDMPNCTLELSVEDYFNESLEVAKFLRTDTSPIRPTVDHYKTAKNLCKPGASGRGPMKELANFMEMLSCKGLFKNKRILSERTIDEMIVAQRPETTDKTFMCIIDWGYGFMIDSKKYQETYPYSFGPGCSEETFGHNGNQSSAAYVDPEHELVICFGFNGLAGEAKHQERLHKMNEAIYQDLGLL
ncbi:MAG: beta-lactamase family protein [Lentisphaeraceae bacterium]|nr:beta-lactamase family protein [Lentisphaeraceae bacterium]